MENFPNFFLVGTAKAGTTSIHSYLTQHPDVFMSELKEPRYFCYNEFSKVNYYRQPMISGLSEYKSLFAGAKGAKAIGEASVHYLYFPATPDKIKAMIPGAKIIIILRDPVSRAFSHYLMDLSAGFVDVDFKDIVFNAREVARFEKHYIQYVELGFYFEQVKRYLDVFAKEHVKILLFEDLMEDAGGIIRSIFEFLGVDPWFNVEVHMHFNAFKTPKGIFRHLYYSIYATYITNWYLRNFLKNLLPTTIKNGLSKVLFYSKKPQADREAEEYLRKFYREDILRLQGLINRNLEHWI